jgi:hypothetical protein
MVDAFGLAEVGILIFIYDEYKIACVLVHPSEYLGSVDMGIIFNRVEEKEGKSTTKLTRLPFFSQ